MACGFASRVRTTTHAVSLCFLRTGDKYIGMHTILATEIYGQNEHTDSMGACLVGPGQDVEIVDPYGGTRLGHISEDDAYARFQQTCGPERYAAMVVRRAWSAVVASGGPLLAVGCSAGAAAVWSLACDGAPGLRYAVCFYGSGIRHSAYREPRCPVEVILPRHESHFDVAALARELAGRRNIILRPTRFSHGFMNPLSGNYDPQGHKDWMQHLGSLARVFR